ncbi:MAG: glycosyltransferase family 4 protein [Bacillota bacterium]
MKPSVAVVSPGLLPIPPVAGGSVETVIQKMAEVTGTRFNVDIYGPVYRSLPAVETKKGLCYYRFPARPYPEYFKLVRAEVNRKNYDLIQVENRPLFIPKTKAANPGSKFILSLHSLDHIAEKLIRPRLTLEIFRQCDKVLVYSRFMRERLAALYPALSGKFHFIHLAVETERYKPRSDPSVGQRAGLLKKRLGIPESRKVILFAGRLIPKKGVDVLIAAMEQVLKVYPGCCLVIVGGGWFGNRRISPHISELHQQAAKMGKKVRFTNYVPPAELPLYFAMADIFVCPSQWDEPFGLVNVEAMASGVPVVASARGGIPEIVTDGLNGFLVQKGHDPGSFVKPILQLLRYPELARTLAASGRRRAEDYFNWPRAGRELTRLYEDLVT